MSRVPVDRLDGYEYLAEDDAYTGEVERGDWYPRAEADALEAIIAAAGARGIGSSAARKALIALWEIRDGDASRKRELVEAERERLRGRNWPS